MILFYSDYCKHSAMLIESVKKHDTKKTIKLVSIDIIRINNSEISNKIHSVPALMFLPSKEIIYGKAVFDYLLLPNRGYLFTNTVSTRDNKENKDKDGNVVSSLNSPIPLNNTNNSKDVPSEPMAFVLGSITSDKYSDITEDNFTSTNINTDKIYKWTIIDDNQDSKTNDFDAINKKYEEQKKAPLPSLDDLQKQRDNIFK